MFKYELDLNQIIADMNENLNHQYIKIAEDKILDNIDELSDWANKLENNNKIKESDYILNFIKKISITKSDPATTGLTVQKMLKNLKEKGTPLNVYFSDDADYSKEELEQDLAGQQHKLEEIDLMPEDYEKCSICGFDHAYEPVESEEEHDKIFEDRNHPDHNNEVAFRKEYGII